MVYNMCVQLYNIYIDWGDVGHMVEYITYFVLDLKLFIDVYTLIYKHREIAAIVGYLREKQALHSKTHDPEQSRIVSQVNRISHYTTIVLTLVMGLSVGVAAVLLTAYSLEHREIPFRKWFPYDVTYTPVFEITVLVVTVMQTYDLFLLGFFAILFITINTQIIGQFALLNYKLANMHDLVSAEIHRRQEAERLARMQKINVRITPPAQPVMTTKKHTLKEVAIALKGLDDHGKHLLTTILADTDLTTAKFLQSCVVHQNELMEHSEVVGSLFHTSYMMQVSCNALTCLAMIYITNFNVNLDAKVAVEGALVFADMAEFAAFCILGTALLEYSCRVAESAYSCEWFGMSRSAKKFLQIVMAKAMKGITFSAFGVFPVTVETFVSVIKFTYSNYTVLESLSTGHKEAP